MGHSGNRGGSLSVAGVSGFCGLSGSSHPDRVFAAWEKVLPLAGSSEDYGWPEQGSLNISRS